ncbi:hypothetical protein F2Q70_00039644 [Brassica cretica]|uniref:Uncharacterized protein n=1 Tax=Brassica cretica TaxID=69181 RepID=A0A8S9KB91_BRACR|nr:hypothetical protein F2Q70_00039644 [Brassica cretica]
MHPSPTHRHNKIHKESESINSRRFDFHRKRGHHFAFVADRYGERGLVILSRVSHRERDSGGVIEESHRPPSRRATERDADCFIIEERSLHRRGEIMKQRGSRRGEMTKQRQRDHESEASSSKRDQEREAESPTDSSIIRRREKRPEVSKSKSIDFISR